MMRKRLLLVDDGPQNLALLEWLLAPLGHELVRAVDGPSAIASLASSRPDLVLLDLGLPGMDGLDVLGHIRSDTRYVPVIILTANSDRDHRLQGLEAGADDFLEKPADGRILRARVSTLLEVNASPALLRELNETLASRNAALERLQSEQRELTAFIVHDLKNPLAAIWSNLEFARERTATARSEVVDALDVASRASRRLRGMIEDLLVLSRLEQSQLPLHPESISIGDLVRDLFVEYERRAAQKQVTLLGPRRTRARVHSDRALLQRVIENILDNSLRYTPRNGRVGVSTRVNGAVEIVVSNSGPPIPLAEREHIFDKFARLEAESSAGNSGIGLYFCKRAVEALGGHIEVTETAEWPTSFVVRLPVA